MVIRRSPTESNLSHSIQHPSLTIILLHLLSGPVLKKSLQPNLNCLPKTQSKENWRSSVRPMRNKFAS
jgi:hypothetical protein